MKRDSRNIIRLLEEDGWYLIGVNGDHYYFKHGTKRGKVSVPHPVKDLPIGTLKSISKQTGVDF